MTVKYRTTKRGTYSSQLRQPLPVQFSLGIHAQRQLLLNLICSTKLSISSFTLTRTLLLDGKSKEDPGAIYTAVDFTTVQTIMFSRQHCSATFLSGMDIAELIGRGPMLKPRSGHFDQWSYRKTSTFKVVGRHVLNLWRVMRTELTLSIYSFENVVFNALGRRYVSPHTAVHHCCGTYHSQGFLGTRRTR